MKRSNYSINMLLLLITAILPQACTEALIGEDGKVEEEIYLKYRTLTNLELPIENEWHIYNGGKTHADGAHHFITSRTGQRYALDLVILVDDKSHSGSGNRNEDYYCFGKRINAPGAGVIIALENNIIDNVPGELNDNSVAGNYVIIDHLNGEYSLLAHFKKGTIIVAERDTVTIGQELGQAGNSGNSTEPHLHYHMQNSPTLLKSTGLPAQFKGYYADNVYIKEGEPTKGQVVTKIAIHP